MPSGERHDPFTAGEEASAMGKRGAAACHAVRRRRKALGETLDVLLRGRETRDRVVLELQDVAPLHEIKAGEGKGTVYIQRDAVLLARLYLIATMDCAGDPRMLQHSIRATELLVDAALNRDRDLDAMEREADAGELEAAQSGVVLMPPVMQPASVGVGAAAGEAQGGEDG